MMTNHEAKLYLAEKLPERISMTMSGNFQLEVDGKWHHIIETEWQQIALWFEEKMTFEEKQLYAMRLFLLCKHNYGVGKTLPSDLTLQFEFTHADYTTRATAMKESGL
jgi:hypothetical protein